MELEFQVVVNLGPLQQQPLLLTTTESSFQSQEGFQSSQRVPEGGAGEQVFDKPSSSSSTGVGAQVYLALWRGGSQLPVFPAHPPECCALMSPAWATEES